ncbi:MAG: hypothetical protein ACE5DO_12370 [Desulfobacterales bacterium]
MKAKELKIKLLAPAFFWSWVFICVFGGALPILHIYELAAIKQMTVIEYYMSGSAGAYFAMFFLIWGF